MRRFYLVLILALSAWAAAAEGWDDIYKARLNASAAYLESKLDLKSAEVALNNYTKPYIPAVSIATSTGTSYTDEFLGIGSDGFFAGSLIPSVTLENLFGADLSLKVPLEASTSGAISLGNPSLSLTRKLFVETGADRMEAEANVMTARAAIKSSEDTVRIALATDILNAIYYQRLLEANKENLEVLEKVRKATIDTTLLRELDRRLFEAQKSILTASSALDNLKDDVKKNADALYEDVLRLQAEWIAAIEGKEPESTLTIRALELSLAAAEKRKAFSLFPYLPNPSITASVNYDTEKNEVGWGLSFKLSYDALNKGQNSLDALKREEYPTIYKIKLEDARDELTDGIRIVKDTLKSLELDRKIQELDIADAEEDMTITERLYNGGYASEEDLVITRIDLSIEKIDAQKIDYDILIQKLNLAHYYDREQ